MCRNFQESENKVIAEGGYDIPDITFFCAPSKGMKPEKNDDNQNRDR